MPYIYATAIKTHSTGVPMMRPLFLEFPEDPFVWNVDTQYMLGPNLLVAPIFNAEGSAQYYLPKGNWYGILDGKIRTGPGFITEIHDFMSIPLLLRPGSAVVFGQEIAEGSGVRRNAVYDYTEGITLFINPDGEMDFDVEVPDSDTPGDISVVLSIKGNADSLTIEVVQGNLKGDWKVKMVVADGTRDVVTVKEGERRIQL